MFCCLRYRDSNKRTGSFIFTVEEQTITLKAFEMMEDGLVSSLSCVTCFAAMIGRRLTQSRPEAFKFVPVGDAPHGDRK